MHRIRQLFAWLVIIGVLVAAGLVLIRAGWLDRGNDPALPDRVPGNAVEAVVEYVYDGDTIEVVVDGTQDTVRLTGINAPETGGNNTSAECFGQEATDALSNLLRPGTGVWLERDQSDRDQYGRLIRFVWLVHQDGSVVLVNEWLVRGGYAMARVYRPDTLYSEVLADGQEFAERERLGIWTSCSLGVPGAAI